MIQIILVTRAATYEKRVEEHKHSVIGKHFHDERVLRPLKLRTNFIFFYKCLKNLVCLIFEKLLMRKKRPKLNTQSDLIRLNLWLKSHGLWAPGVELFSMNCGGDSGKDSAFATDADGLWLTFPRSLNM